MDKKQVELGLKIIKASVDNLLQMLPEEQRMKGSECQRIDSLANELYVRYVLEKPNVIEDIHPSE